MFIFEKQIGKIDQNLKTTFFAIKNEQFFLDLDGNAKGVLKRLVATGAGVRTFNVRAPSFGICHCSKASQIDIDNLF